MTVTELIGMPSRAPSEKLTSGDMSLRSDHQMTWRIGCWSCSSPKRSASSTAARRSGSAGKSGGSGRRRSSSREICFEPWVRTPSTFIAGTVLRGKPRPRRAALLMTGIRSVRLNAIPLWASISCAAVPGCEPGIV